MEVFAIYHAPTKSFIMSSGYYGNSTDIKCFRSKDECQDYIDTYHRESGYKPKRIKVQ